MDAENMTVGSRLSSQIVASALLVLNLSAVIAYQLIDVDVALGYSVTTVMLSVAFLGLAVLGTIVILKRVASRIGWIILLTGTCGSVFVIAERTAIALFDSGSPEAAKRVVTAGAVTFALFLLGLALLFLLFPTGRPASRRWRVLLVLAPAVILALIVFSVLLLLQVEDLAAFLRANWDYSQAGADISETLILMDSLATLSSVIVVFVPAVSLALRLRTSEGAERQQVKWVVYTGVVAAAGWVFALSFPLPPAIEIIPAGVGALALTVGLGISLFKFRLYEIDRIASRTIAYAVVVGVLGLVYAVGAIWLPARLTDTNSPLLVAVSTLAVAALFNPVRRRVLSIVDRRFYRSRFEAERVLADFSSRLQDQVEAGAMGADLEKAVIATMQPAVIGLWIPGAEDR
ncbi:MAG: hypothetical protein WBM90_11645 [Acidimicrobiia bacterium]